jgi:NAD(P)-dependent dehydrogenase (short-subunit alcohol dehydrogenase family)
VAEVEFGRLDFLINNAGIHGRLGLEETTEDEWSRVIDADLKSAWLGMKACIPAFRRSGGGAIVNTSSVYGMVASGKATAYHAAKGGVLMLSRAAAVEYAGENIRVNSIHPGLIETPMTETLPANWKSHLRELTPMRRSASPNEVATAALFLLSKDASFITGAQLVIDGVSRPFDENTMVLSGENGAADYASLRCVERPVPRAEDLCFTRPANRTPLRTLLGDRSDLPKSTAVPLSVAIKHS